MDTINTKTKAIMATKTENTIKAIIIGQENDTTITMIIIITETKTITEITTEEKNTSTLMGKKDLPSHTVRKDIITITIKNILTPMVKGINLSNTQ